MREYVRYRVSPTRPSPKPRNVEFVVITDTSGEPASKEKIDNFVKDIKWRASRIPVGPPIHPNVQLSLERFEHDEEPSSESRKKAKQLKRCSICGFSGHNSRTCPYSWNAPRSMPYIGEFIGE